MGGIEQLGATRLLPVLRLATAEYALRAVDACLAAGLSVVELTAITTDWEVALERAAGYPGILVGLGTVTRAEEARRALDHGADFLVSPFPVPEARAALPLGTILIEGGMTVREVVEAARHEHCDRNDRAEHPHV